MLSSVAAALWAARASAPAAYSAHTRKLFLLMLMILIMIL